MKPSYKDTAKNETEVAEKFSWDQANRGKKLGLVWRNRKKISQTINDYLCLLFFLLIILWWKELMREGKPDTRNGLYVEEE